jgi:hypothetical protein
LAADKEYAQNLVGIFFQDVVKKDRELLSVWEDNIKVDFIEVNYDEGSWVKFAQDCVQRQDIVTVVLNL